MNYKTGKSIAILIFSLSCAAVHGFEAESRVAQRPARDYSKFSHRAAAHARLACSSCHKFPSANWKQARKGDDAFPDVTDYPQHSACISCHRQQFFSGSPPRICTICHSEPSPRNSARHAFPNPREIFDATPKGQGMLTQFAIYFPHDKHDALGDKESCASCHETYKPQGEGDDEYMTARPKELPEESFWLKKGTFKTTPTSHATCFTCHSEDSGLKPAPTDCAICHKLMTVEPRGDFDSKIAEAMGVKDRVVLEKWRRRDAARFRHEFFSHAEMDCKACHNLAAMNTADEKTKKVSLVPCKECHIGATADEGVLNAEIEQKKKSAAFECIKCHVTNGKQAVPESHLKAMPAAVKQ
jgi:hypothetical protein